MHHHAPVVVVFTVFEAGDVPPPQQQFLVLDNEQRSTDTPSVGVDTYLRVANVTNDRNLDKQPCSISDVQ